MIMVLLIWILCGIAPIAVPGFLLMRRRTRKAGIAFLLVYVAAYFLLAFNGQYVARDTSGGWGVVGSRPQKIAYYWWCPLGFGNSFGTDGITGRPIKEQNALCALFWPLWSIDCLLLHPTKPN